MDIQKLRNKIKGVFKEHQDNVVFKYLEGDLVEPLAAGDHVDIFLEIYAKGNLDIKSDVISRDKNLKLTCILETAFRVVNIKQIGSTNFEATLNQKGKSIIQSAIEQIELEEKIEKQAFDVEYLDF